MAQSGGSHDTFLAKIKSVGDQTTAVLDALIAPVSGYRGKVVDAMRYSALSGGKRLRPYLTVATAQLFDVSEKNALRTGAAIEMIHCYSLIHDDLPAMDDSDLRRGQPSVHKKFDEATAILAGDALLTQAFEVLADPKTHEDPAIRAELVMGLAIASGAAGMVGGQMIDICSENEVLDLDAITELQRLKTGALIHVSCMAGAILGGASAAQREVLSAYAQNLGLAFQIADDILDIEGTAEQIGKPVGQDADMDKSTFVSLLGLEKAKQMANDLIAEACDKLAIFSGNTEDLKNVARFVVERRN